MNFLLRFVIFCLDPLGLGRRFLIRPTLNLAWNVYDRLRSKADEKVGTVRELVPQILMTSIQPLVQIRFLASGT